MRTEFNYATLNRIKAEIAEVHEYIKTLEVDSFPYRVAVGHLQALQREHSRVSSYIPPEQPKMAERIPVPIKCGLRGISNLPKKEKVESWNWDSLSEKQAGSLQELQNEIHALFFLSADRHILKLILLSGGLKKALEKTSLSALAVLPEFVRKEQGAVLLKTFEEKLLK